MKGVCQGDPIAAPPFSPPMRGCRGDPLVQAGEVVEVRLLLSPATASFIMIPAHILAIICVYCPLSISAIVLRSIHLTLTAITYGVLSLPIIVILMSSLSIANPSIDFNNLDVLALSDCSIIVSVSIVLSLISGLMIFESVILPAICLPSCIIAIMVLL